MFANKELKIVSRIAQLNTPAPMIYRMISDFSFISKVEPPDKRIKIVSSDADSCKIVVEGGGELGLRIVEREENSLVKIANESDTKLVFTMWLQLKEVKAYDTRLRITLHVSANAFMKMALQKPLTNFVENIVCQLEKQFRLTDNTYDTNYEA